MTVPPPEPDYSGDPGLNVVPHDWLDVAVGGLMVDDTAARRAMRGNAPVRSVNGNMPDEGTGNIDLPTTRPTKDQVRAVFMDVIKSGDNMKFEADPISGDVTVHAHNIGSVWTVNGQCGHVVITKADLGLDRVDNTSDLEKPVSNATRAFINQVRNELITMINNLRTELIAYITQQINNLRTEVKNYTDSKVSTLRTEVINWLGGKSDKGHKHPISDIEGLSQCCNWTSWVPVALTNGWTGNAHARTNGQIVALSGEIHPGTSLLFGNLPSNFPTTGYSVGYGSHVVDIKDKYGNTIPGGHELRVTRVEQVGRTLAVNGYTQAVNGHQLDGTWIFIQ